VHMKQFPSGQLFSERLKNGQLDLGHMAALGRKVAQFHAQCTTNEKILSFGTVPVVRRAYDENYAQTEKYIAPGIQTRQQLDETRKYTDNYFLTKQHLFQKRIEKRMIKEGHGDLHLRNITLDGDDIVLFDCIEFSEEFRFIDTMYDIGFVVVGLESKGRTDMSNEFLNEYLERTGDWDGVEILRIYLTRQAYVKAKVKSFTYDDDNVEEEVKTEFIRDAKIYYTLAWKYTQVTPGRVFVMCGLSGSGKSFVAKKLCVKYNAVLVRSDAVRKHLCHVPLDDHNDKEIYTSEVSQMTYEYLRDIGCKLVPEGWNVVLDATYSKKSYREDVIKKCHENKIDMKIVYCTAPVEELRRRVRQRKGDITDATESVLEMQLPSVRNRTH
jgi:predicted kinase